MQRLLVVGRTPTRTNARLVAAKRASFRRPEVAAFLGFALNNQATIAKNARFVPLTAAQATKARTSFQRALRQVFG